MTNREIPAGMATWWAARQCVTEPEAAALLNAQPGNVFSRWRNKFTGEQLHPAEVHDEEPAPYTVDKPDDGAEDPGDQVTIDGGQYRSLMEIARAASRGIEPVRSIQPRAAALLKKMRI